VLRGELEPGRRRSLLIREPIEHQRGDALGEGEQVELDYQAIAHEQRPSWAWRTRIRSTTSLPVRRYLAH
jgi:hypothetical protein